MRPPASRPPLPRAVRLGNLGVRLGLAVIADRIVVEGAEHVPDEPSVILASNHLSILDPPVLTVTIARLICRQVRYMAKAEAFDVPLLGTVLRAYGGFAVRRGRADREAYRAAREVLESGAWLGLAPEGTRSRSGHLGEPKSGVALLAIRSGATVLPVGISGTERAWPVGARLPRPGRTMTVRFGMAYRPADASGADRRQEVEVASEALMRAIAALLPPSYRGRFG
ncbi:MAG: lysophospholipid acyltransferase family protein [Candidatus Limnocylindrales bacterium]